MASKMYSMFSQTHLFFIFKVWCNQMVLMIDILKKFLCTRIRTQSQCATNELYWLLLLQWILYTTLSCLENHFFIVRINYLSCLVTQSKSKTIITRNKLSFLCSSNYLPKGFSYNLFNTLLIAFSRLVPIFIHVTEFTIWNWVSA